MLVHGGICGISGYSRLCGVSCYSRLCCCVSFEGEFTAFSKGQLPHLTVGCLVASYNTVYLLVYLIWCSLLEMSMPECVCVCVCERVLMLSVNRLTCE